MQDNFDVPVVLFLFRRMKAVDIINRIAEVRPKKLYLLADEGRTESEKDEARKCRTAVEAAITWDCEVVRRYAECNIGVYANIGIGAQWVFEREERAIFLEDDNLPEVSFFHYCEELLTRFKNESNILWICGTNYMGKYDTPHGDSYLFTRHMLPCGWASWADKFLECYDGELSLCSDESLVKNVRKYYSSGALYRQYKHNWQCERARILSGQSPLSWDYQMDFAIKAHSAFGICPARNQIRNIGVDEFSEHGGVSFDLEMTRRFCGMNSYPLTFPLKHPEKIAIDPIFEKKIGRIMTEPFLMRIKRATREWLKSVFGIPPEEGIKEHFGIS